MKEVLYIAARRPIPGQVKTRLGASIGHDAAAQLYAAFLADLERAFSNAPFPVRWFTTGGWNGPHLDQGVGDWTARQARLFEGAATRNEDSVVLIASDSPQLTASVVSEAFQLLRRHALVLGPVRDGGYYLIGMRGSHDVLSGVRMTTATVTSDIVRRARRLGIPVGWLPVSFDVDDVDDLARLDAVLRVRPDLVHTAAALRTINAGRAA